MTSLIFPVVDALSVLTLIGDVIAAVLLILLFNNLGNLRAFVLRNALPFMLVVALIATFGSLFLSEVAGWTPCKMCWLQRIFMYPQVVLLTIAIRKRDRTVAHYILALCIIGAIIAALHYFEQMQATFWPEPVDPLIPCDETGSCAQTYTFRFGYITIPMMALTAFVMNGLSSLLVLGKKKI